MTGEKLNGPVRAIDFVNLRLPPTLGQHHRLQLGYRSPRSAAAVRRWRDHPLRSGRGADRSRARDAINELRGLYGTTRNRSVIVLLSDGQHNGDPADVLAAANDARADRMVVYAIGLGNDVDTALLTKVAGPGRYFPATSPTLLKAIYRAIAGVIPCR
jgi:hypothetical protein